MMEGKACLIYPGGFTIIKEGVLREFWVGIKGEGVKQKAWKGGEGGRAVR